MTIFLSENLISAQMGNKFNPVECHAWTAGWVQFVSAAAAASDAKPY